jgi:hypothetical protein
MNRRYWREQEIIGTGVLNEVEVADAVARYSRPVAMVGNTVFARRMAFWRENMNPQNL